MAREKGIHIVASSYEYDRIIEPLFGDYPVEKIIILKGDTEYPEISKITNQFSKKLEENIPKEIEIEEIDIYNFDKVFQKTLQIFRNHSDSDTPFYLNISSAPKLALTAMLSAAYFYHQKSEIEVFYVAPKDYLVPEMLNQIDKLGQGNDEETVENLKNIRERYQASGIAVGVSNYEEIPLFSIESINELDLEILKVLKEKKTVNSIAELVEELEEKTREEIKRTSVQYRLQKLDEKGLIKTSRVERRMQIEINRVGEIYLESYRGEEEEL